MQKGCHQRHSYLQFVRLDILPEGTDDDRSCLGVNSEQSRQARIQLELKGLVVQQQKNGAAHILISWTFYLEVECNTSTKNSGNQVQAMQTLSVYTWRRYCFPHTDLKSMGQGLKITVFNIFEPHNIKVFCCGTGLLRIHSYVRRSTFFTF